MNSEGGAVGPKTLGMVKLEGTIEPSSFVIEHHVYPTRATSEQDASTPVNQRAIQGLRVALETLEGIALAAISAR